MKKKMKYTEQAVETLDDAGSVIANKNIEIEQLRQRVAKLEKELSDVRKAEREKCAALCEKSDRYRGDYFAAKIRAMGDE